MTYLFPRRLLLAVGLGACAWAASCTINSASGGAGGGVGQGGGTLASGGAAGVAGAVGGSAQAGSAGSANPPPAALVGDWEAIDSSGSLTYSIHADGTFTESTLISISSSLVDYFIYETGTITATAAAVTFYDQTNTRYTKNSSDATFPTTGTSQTLTTNAYTWRIQTDTSGTALCLTDTTSSEVCYQKQ